jgi:RNA polymerase sigma factor (sigma-70 family)
MPENGDIQRCLRLAALLDAEHGWGLTPQAQRSYAEQIPLLYANIAGADDAQLCAILRYYHHDHALVEVLRDPLHPESAEHWAEWTRLALRFLTAKSGGYGADEAVTSLEDLVQEAVQDLWRGLHTFRYQSSFQTWAFSVIGNCLARHYRGLHTQKRAALPPAQSLDAMLAVGDTLHDQVTPPPDETALGTTLATLVWRALEQHPDRRLAVIFQLWVWEEQTLRAIGDQLHLSPARVHALLKQAITLLRDEVAIQEWTATDSITILTA